jgi:hypothetical protein
MKRVVETRDSGNVSHIVDNEHRDVKQNRLPHAGFLSVA